ncbi:MAG: hypothetical protein A3F31_01295 [Candidatus Levybacteria bacterium RIFCSPHIGHO2_12_FULL_38_12]|nr:MAG: hypothetical protein A2770_02015 [Candidatus Levybacteria bacterium RIFCSPHIGHO2_01_FULL_38_12]OGH23297.1 MAG: hypothetical protein A3F31_01295 [Candidatus Levybacteria bacterium RIFCSPHIGHO2_12_FULL_38_12]OGH34440.1 MAG: hypothetical protein A3A47_00215 [Candidatus Levybacteria bacterium RIFCSPLOWO2_01_FULL_37_20]OGH44262.1 MAG: hypothetical protein A3J14_01775 [Candidatus Levybacteria bacterium RIFCSPLOWO2_02_FULL_37_18]
MIVVMRKILAPLVAAISYLTLAMPAFAVETEVDVCPKDGSFSPLCGLTVDRFGPIVGQAIGLIFVLAIILALGYLIYGAIKWITSEGDKGHVETARNQIIAAIIGLVIIALSYLIINLVLNFFLGSGVNLSNLKIPTLKTVTDQPTAIPVPT